MNPDPIKELFQKANNIALDETKKAAMAREISEFMKKNPMRPIAPKAWNFTFLTNAKFNSRPVVAFATLAVLLVAGSITTVVKADSALPGDILYPAKLGFNEKIKQVLAFSDQAKLELNINLAEARLQEIEQLAVEHKIDQKAEIQVRDNLKEHASQASFYIDKLQASQNDPAAADAAAGFEASLKAHKVIINGIGNKSANPAAPGASLNAKAMTMFAAVENVSPLIQDIDDITATVSHGNIYHSDEAVKKSSDKKKAVEDKITAAENSVKSAQTLIEKNKHKIGAQGFAQSQSNLDLARQKIAESKKKFSENNDYQASAPSLHEAGVIAEESKNLINRKVDLGLDISIDIPGNGHNDGK